MPSGETANRQAELALDRTDLANERTLLAYWRTALMSAGSGLTLLKLYADNGRLRVVAVILIVAGAGLLVVGIGRFFALRRRLHRRGVDETS